MICTMSISASEVDQFTNRYEPLSDASTIINQQANIFFKKALTIANKKNSCKEKKLYKSLRKFFRNHIKGQLTPFVLESSSVPKRIVALENSIYQTLDFNLSPVIRSSLYFNTDTSGVIVRMGDTQIGSDKFEHFFGRGWAYFERMYKKGKSITSILKYGNYLERYHLGAATTGVYSYGDLVANFNGMRFWNHILQKHDDILGADQNLGPYVECQNSKWVQVKQLNFLDYIDAAWDEANNCSNFKNERAVALINIQILKQASDKTDALLCPIQEDRMISLQNSKYVDFSEDLLNFSSKPVFD